MSLFSTQQKFKIAIADDHILVASLLKDLLENNGPFIVEIVAHDGEELIFKLKSSDDIDAILMDISMPGMGGLEATKLIKQTRDEIIIIALTMHSMNSIEKKFFESGGNYYIYKDIEPEELLIKLMEILTK